MAKVRNRDIAAAPNEIERKKLEKLKANQDKDQAKAEQERIDAINAERSQIKEAVAKVAKTEAGRILLRTLRNSCGAGQPICKWNPQTGEVPTNLMLMNASKNDIWAELRQLIPVQELIMIEHNIAKVVPLPDETE